MRVRFTIDGEAWKRAVEYAGATHRTPSELVVEALEQMQARYPKKAKIDAETEERIARRVLTLLRATVPAGTL
jgi:hypothetical protein